MMKTTNSRVFVARLFVYNNLRNAEHVDTVKLEALGAEIVKHFATARNFQLYKLFNTLYAAAPSKSSVLTGKLYKVTEAALEFADSIFWTNSFRRVVVPIRWDHGERIITEAAWLHVYVQDIPHDAKVLSSISKEGV